MGAELEIILTTDSEHIAECAGRLLPKGPPGSPAPRIVATDTLPPAYFTVSGDTARREYASLFLPISAIGRICDEDADRFARLIGAKPMARPWRSYRSVGHVEKGFFAEGSDYAAVFCGAAYCPYAGGSPQFGLMRSFRRAVELARGYRHTALIVPIWTTRLTAEEAVVALRGGAERAIQPEPEFESDQHAERYYRALLASRRL